MLRLVLSLALLAANNASRAGPEFAEERLLKEVLAEIYGTGWSSVDKEQAPCEWTGIECELIQEVWRVAKIELKNSNIQGRLPDALGQLSWLQQLKISGKLRGPLPATLGRLGRLEIFDLSQNPELSGELPESIGALKQLRTLRLSRSRLSGPLPSSIGALSRLTVFEAANCGFSGPLPEAIGLLSQLQVLDLDYNQLTGPLPQSVGFMSQLGILRLSNNALSGSIPDSFGELRMLSFVDLDHNHLEGELPASLARLPQLNYFHASANKLSAEVPYTLAGLPKLVKLVTTGKNCAPLLRDPCDLFGLDKDSCMLQEDATEQVETVLKDLWGSNYDEYKRNLGNCPCRWPGVLCHRLQGTWIVWGLHFQDDKLVGEITESIGSLKQLRSLRLNGRLTGSLPAALPTLSQLALLDLSNNQLQGTIPSLASLDKLLTLSLSGNQLTGGLPKLPAQLQDLDLSQNQLDGELLEIGTSMAQLRKIDVSRNKFTGALPDSWAPLTELKQLRLSGNGFSQAVPASLGKLAFLQELDLSQTGLQGALPGSLEQLPLLWSLNLSSTQVTASGQVLDNCAPLTEDACGLLGHSDRTPLGAVLKDFRVAAYWKHHPEAQYDVSVPFCSWTGVRCEEVEGRLRVVELRVLGPMTQAMHPDIQYLKHLRVLYVRGFRGTLPETMAKLSKLEELYVQGAFSGPVPVFLGELRGLTKLSLQGALSGNIPASIGSLKQLTVLDLNDNRLRDFFPRVVSVVLSHLQKLSELRLGGLEALHGTIPPQLVTHLPELRVLQLDHNILNGDLPAELSKLSHLEELDLRYNKFTGQVPLAWRDLAKLRALGLAGNQLDAQGTITAENCAPVSGDPCRLFSGRLGFRTGLGVIETSLLLSVLLFLDRLEQRRRRSPIPSGALELVARYSCQTSYFTYAVSMAAAVAHVGAPAASMWFSAWYGYFLLAWLLFRQLQTAIFTGRVELHPLRWCFPQGLTTARVHRLEVMVASAVIAVLSAVNLVFACVGKGMSEEELQIDGKQVKVAKQAVFGTYHALLLIIACVSIYRAHGSAGDASPEQARKDMQRAALLVQFVTSNTRWADEKERTVYIDLNMLDSGQLPGGGGQVEMQSTPAVASQDSSTLALQSDPGPIAEAPSEKTPVRIAAASRFTHGGPMSLTLRWSDPDTGRSQEHQVWMLEPGPMVFGGPGGLAFDVFLVLMVIALCLNMARVLLKLEDYWFPALLIAAVWRMTIWNLPTWLRLYREVPESLARGFYTDGLVQLRYDAFGGSGTILMSVCFCQLHRWLELESEFDKVSYELTLPACVALVGAQLRLRDKLAGLAA